MWNTHMYEIDTDIEQTYGTEREEREKQNVFVLYSSVMNLI